MFVHLVFATWLNCIFAAGTIAAANVPVQAFHANYEVLRNGKAIGEATLSLRDTGNGIWEFDSHTRGTSGMAGLLGVDVTEKSMFRWRNGQPQGLNYRYTQNAAIKSRTREIDFDWDATTAFVHDGKKTHAVTLLPNAVDRSLVTVALMADLQNHAPTLAYQVVHKDKISTERYAQRGREKLDLPAGHIQAVRVERDAGNSNRQTTSWFAPERAWLPVKIEQIEKHGDTVTLLLQTNPH